MKVYLNIICSLLICLSAVGCLSFGQSTTPKITSISHTVKGTVIVITGKTNQKYRIQKTGDLLTGKWKNVGNVITSQSKEITFIDTDTADSSQFYRIILPD